MTVITDIEHARTRLRARKSAPALPPWRFPDLADFYQNLRVLAFDATLSHCGWVCLEVQDRVLVHAKGCINPCTGRTSFFSTWDKAYELQVKLGFVFGSCFNADHRVVEGPSVGGGSRTESSLIAGMLVWMDDPGRCTVISATHVSSVLLGDHQVKSGERKKRIREAVIRLIPEAAARDWNEHIRDAAATALTHLHDWARGHEQHAYLADSRRGYDRR